MEKGVRLAQALPEYDVISTLGVLRDLPPQVADLYAVLEMVANSTKPLVLLIWFGPVLMAFGGLLSLSDRRLRVGAPKPAKAARALQAAE